MPTWAAGADRRLRHLWRGWRRLLGDVGWTSPSGRRWLDVGCGTGTLAAAVLAAADPREIEGVDQSSEYIGTATARIVDPRARFAIGEARALSAPAAAFDVVVAGLSLNRIPDPEAALAEMARIARSGGIVAAYVWDYAGEMQLVRTF